MQRFFLGALLAVGLVGCSIQPSSNKITDISVKEANEVASSTLSPKLEGGSAIEIHVVSAGDTLANILEEMGASISHYYALPESARTRFASLHPGDEVAVGRTENGRLTFIGKSLSDEEWQVAQYALEGGIELRRGDLPYERQSLRLSARITQAGRVPSSLEGELAPSLRRKVQSLLDPSQLPLGTEMNVLAEQAVLGGNRLGDPELIAVQAVPPDGEMSLAMRYARDTGELHYFDQNGSPLASTWVEHPVVGIPRITSSFDRHRRHPITGRIRSHNGVDYAAATGTPVLAASRGVVIHAGWRGSWGRLITIRHPDGSETHYAHLSGIEPATQQGAKVEAGQIIGQVGTTGRSTGPHLHFERRVAGRPINPIGHDGTIRPDSSLKPHERLDFLAARQRALSLIQSGVDGFSLAMASEG